MSTTETPRLTLADMTAEIVENNRRLGWHDNPPAFTEAMAMLHSEVSEALEAWRVWGLADGTAGSAISPGGDPGAKPEGIGSEFADILIRLLDDGYLYGVDLEREAAAGALILGSSFPDNINTLHNLIARASMFWQDEPDANAWRRELGAVLIFLRQLCELYGVDLDAEYKRKAAYNRTRAFRHGGKRL